MYKRDVPKLVEYLDNAGPDGLVNIGTFVACSIRNPISRLKQQVSDVKLNKINSKYLWGHKKNTYTYLINNKNELFNLVTSNSNSLVETFRLVREIPGFGLPKAGFFLQMCGKETACLDVHNLRDISLPHTALKSMDEEAYLALCSSKSSEQWWDDWCTKVANSPKNKDLDTPDKVSWSHVEAVVES